jgi:MFS transporter, MFS domain-containing protein family, molybdate-anion transporter
MIELESQDPFHSAYYYTLILSYTLIFGLIQLAIYLYKSKSPAYRTRKFSSSIDEGKEYPKEFIKNKDYLKFKYLLAYCLTRASIWAKSPYMYTLYNKYHGFDVSEIGVLYVVDAVAGLISGPIFGSWADKFGRKLFCMNYCVFVILNLSLRLTGSKPLAYVAQILTGFGSGLINTTFESWVVYESRKVFEGREQENEKFLKRLFKNQNLYDAIISLLVSGISALVYTNFGIIITIIISMSYSVIALFIIFFLWEENKPNTNSETKKSSFWEALQELKKRDVLSIGIIESLFQACLNLFIFSWTPLLQLSTTYTEINVGFIFVCYVIMTVIGTAIFEFFIIIMKSSYYPSMVTSLLLGTIMWYLVYTIDSLFIRIISLSIINVKNHF